MDWFKVQDPILCSWMFRLTDERMVNHAVVHDSMSKNMVILMTWDVDQEKWRRHPAVSHRDAEALVEEYLEVRSFSTPHRIDFDQSPPCLVVVKAEIKPEVEMVSTSI